MKRLVDALNSGQLDGIVMTDQVGSCGHTLTGANMMIFLGSLYSPTQEQQAIGISSYLFINVIGRICRQDQIKVPIIVIIADPSFTGDRTAFTIKAGRALEEKSLHIPFESIGNDLLPEIWLHRDALSFSEPDFQNWCTRETQRTREFKLYQKRRREEKKRRDQEKKRREEAEGQVGN
jgi:SNF2 family DNA or RNA helicase